MDSNAFDYTNVNTTISDYSIDELFTLLSVTVTPTSSYQEIQQQIELSADNYIKQFQSLGKPDIVQFFKDVKKSLIGIKDIKSTNEEIVISKNGEYVPFGDNKPTYGDNPYNSNNGAGNPIYRKTVTTLLNIDSRFRNDFSPSSTDYTIVIEPISNVIEMTLSDLELPSTYYPISTANQNNYFWIKTTDFLNHEYFYYILIPDGNYYFQTLVEKINKIFEEVGLNMSISVDLNYNNVGGIGEGTGLTTIGIQSTNDISNNSTNLGIKTFEIKFNGLSPTLLTGETSRSIGPGSYNYNNYIKDYIRNNSRDYKQLFGFILGYRKPIYSGENRDYMSINSFLFYKSESIIDLSGPKYFYLIIDDRQTSSHKGFKTAGDLGILLDNVIARISQKGQIFSIQSQNDFSVYSQPRYYYGPVNINSLDIKLVDEYKNIVTLNNMDFSFTLKMTVVYSAT
jgi:hypothetical protein